MYNIPDNLPEPPNDEEFYCNLCKNEQEIIVTYDELFELLCEVDNEKGGAMMASFCKNMKKVVVSVENNEMSYIGTIACPVCNDDFYEGEQL